MVVMIIYYLGGFNNGERHNNSFVYMPVDTNEVVSVIKSLKSKSSHIYCIPTFIFKSIAHIVLPLTACLINLSFLELVPIYNYPHGIDSLSLIIVKI